MPQHVHKTHVGEAKLRHRGQGNEAQRHKRSRHLTAQLAHRFIHAVEKAHHLVCATFAHQAADRQAHGVHHVAVADHGQSAMQAGDLVDSNRHIAVADANGHNVVVVVAHGISQRAFFQRKALHKAHAHTACLSVPLEDRDEAAKQLEALADGGDRYAQYLTGILYRDGGLLIPDAEKAQHYLELAAQQNHAAAQYALGRLLLTDDLEVQNPAQGFYWLERAAQNGSDYAAYRLGKEYLSGKNAPQKPERAAEYVRMAAEQGNPYAQYLLGKLCLSGDGVPQDKDAAYDWFQKAQAQGHDYAGFFMDRIERPESPNVLLSATRLLYHMGKIFQSSAPAPQSCGVQIDRKRLAKLRWMRMAAGHKADDHEQEQSSTMSMVW